jgi:hypothetical protein
MTHLPPPVQHASYGMMPHRGVLILVLGIVSLTVCAPVGIVAWVMGSGDLKKMRSGGMDPEGKGLTMGGMICGIVSTVLLILLVLFYALILLIFGAAAIFGGAAGAGGP